MGFNDIVGTALDPILTLHHLCGLILVTLGVNLIITLAYKYLTDQEALKSLKEETKELQKQMKEMKNDTDMLMKLRKQSFEKSIASFKQSFKPMIVTMLPLLVVFGYLRAYYTGLGDPKLFLTFGWLGTYLIFSIVFNLVLRKLFKVH